MGKYGRRSGRQKLTVPNHRGRETSLGQEGWTGEVTSRPGQHLGQRNTPNVAVREGVVGRGEGGERWRGKASPCFRLNTFNPIALLHIHPGRYGRRSTAFRCLSRIPRQTRPTVPQAKGGHRLWIWLEHPRRIPHRSRIHPVWGDTGVRDQHGCDLSPKSTHRKA